MYSVIFHINIGLDYTHVVSCPINIDFDYTHVVSFLINID